MTTNTKKSASFILTACILVNLSIGVLFAWSVIKRKLMLPIDVGGWGWSAVDAGLPYTLAIICMAIGVLIGGRVQDSIGPRWVITTGGALAGLGLIFSGLIGNDPTSVIIFFGVVSGMGFGLCYGCVTPPALKWFHPTKKGLVSGLIVGGFGMAPLYLAPLSSTLLINVGIENTMMILGASAILISIPLAQFINNPPSGYIPPAPKSMKETVAKPAPAVDYTWREMIKTKRFYYIFFMYLFSASVGLMVIGKMSSIAYSAGISNVGIIAGLVSFLAVTNSLGRVAGGMMADKIGVINALHVVFILQAANMIGFMFYGSLVTIIIGIIFAGFCYGTLVAVFPVLTAGQYGLKNYGANYGIVFLSWGLAGAVAPIMADYLYQQGKFDMALIICAIVTALLVFVNILLKKDLSKVRG